MIKINILPKKRQDREIYIKENQLLEISEAYSDSIVSVGDYSKRSGCFIYPGTINPLDKNIF